MIRTLPLLLAAATLPVLDDPVESTDAGPWQVHDAVVGVVETRAITQSDLREAIFAPGSAYTVSTREEFDRAVEEEFRRAVRMRLRATAGEDLGLGPQIDAHVDRVVSMSRRDLSAFEFREQLSERGLDPTSNREEIREEVLRYVWELAVTGEGAAAVGRVTRDRYVRPGQLRAFYEDVKDEFRDPPPRVRLQILTVSHASTGSAEAAARICTEQREEILAGKDFALAVEEYGAERRATGGETGWLDPRRLPPDLRRFCRDADLDELSPVLTLYDSNTGQPAAHQVVLLLARDPGGAPPPFSDPRVQDELRRRYQALVTNVRVRQAEESLLDRAYVWSAL